tara:strand:+ start:212 stop:421 length:210 start_codon:yes stop_codon:yes gene_type:complete
LKKRYKINRNKSSFKVPPDEVINKYKNFKDLRMQYNDIVKRPKEPLYKNKKLFLILLLLALIAYLLSTI